MDSIPLAPGRIDLVVSEARALGLDGRVCDQPDVVRLLLSVGSETVEIVYDLVVIVHFLGLASLIGGWFVQVRARGGRIVNPAMLHGALTQLATGVIIVGLGEAALDREYDYAKITTKLVITAAIVLLVWVNRRKDAIPDGLYGIIGGASVLNVVLAVLW